MYDVPDLMADQKGVSAHEVHAFATLFPDAGAAGHPGPPGRGLWGGGKGGGHPRRHHPSRVAADTLCPGPAASVTAPLASYEVYWGPGAQAFIKAINEAGGIHGRKLE